MTILLVRLLPITLALRRVVGVVASIALLLVCAIVAIALLALAVNLVLTVVFVT